MDDIKIILIVLAIVVLVSVYIFRNRKSGVKCIGCPEGKSCSGNCGNCVTTVKK